ncbi:MAG: prolyl oligopeptidase family serine peptidase [Vicinamibacterales bacterium]
MRRTLVAAIVVVMSIGAASAQKRPATFDDVLQMKTVAAPAVSPDGAQVLYTVRQWEPASERDKDRMEARSHVWKVPTNGSSPARQITFGERGESQPQWSPDGRSISFLAARGSGSGEDAPRSQIYVMRADGGESWALTEGKEAVTAYSWSPDSSRIVYLMTDARSKEEEANLSKRDDERVFEGNFRYAHAWVVEVSTKTATRITDGTSYTVSGAPSWAPDSKRFVFAAGTTPMLRDNRRDIYIADVTSKQIEKISTNFGSDNAPKWSPDGNTIAWTAEPNDGPAIADGTASSVVVQSRLMLYDVARKTVTDTSTPTFDVDAGVPQWAAEGRRVVFVAGRRAYNEAFAFDLTTKAFSQLSSKRTLQFGSQSSNRKTIVVTMDSPDTPAEIYVTDPTFANFRRLTTTNPQVSDFALGESEVITWKSSDGMEVEGVLLKPVGYQSGRRYPTLVVAHGGPSGVSLNNFRMGGLEGGQVWAGQGWAVFYPNPRGSSNYGEKFLRANVVDWGGGDYKDIMTGVDALVARGIADPDKLAHIGWSYGGYMTAWVITQTTRFKAAMVGAGLTNMWSMYGTNDIPSALIAYFGDSPNSKTMPLYLDRSALSHIDKITTPTLILHGSNDERVPIGQPMELYRALKDRGKPTELVFYPREGHGISEYYHLKDRMTRIYDWVTRYTLSSPEKKTITQQ